MAVHVILVSVLCSISGGAQVTSEECDWSWGNRSTVVDQKAADLRAVQDIVQDDPPIYVKVDD